MHVGHQMLRGFCLASLLAISLGPLDEVFAQTRPRAPGYVPPHLSRPVGTGVRQAEYTAQPVRTAGMRRITEKDVVEGGTYYEDPKSGQLLMGKMPLAEPEMIEPMVESEGDCGATDSCGAACLTPCSVFPFGNLELFAGVQGFTGPRNLGESGSFGFHEGLNFAVPLPGFACMGGQAGFRATQSSLSGSDFTDDSRNQVFVTGGLFRRVDVGLQGGVVVDYLSETWYNDIDLVNLRGELSWVVDGCHDFGFWMSAATKSQEEPAAAGNVRLEDWESTDLYAFFYRYTFGCCRDGEARLFGGWSGNSDGLIGVDLRLPLFDNFALETGFAYLIPNEGTGAGFTAGHTQESWNVGLSLVWYPGRNCDGQSNYYRPLFRVADNGNFMIDRAATAP